MNEKMPNKAIQDSIMLDKYHKFYRENPQYKIDKFAMSVIGISVGNSSEFGRENTETKMNLGTVSRNLSYLFKGFGSPRSYILELANGVTNIVINS